MMEKKKITLQLKIVSSADYDVKLSRRHCDEVLTLCIMSAGK